MTKTMAIACLAATSVFASSDWSEPVLVRAGVEPCISYRARLAGDYLVVEATPLNGWHTFAMDNDVRAKEALAGKMSLGVDAPTKIKILSGAQQAGPWLQSEPEDFSKPELRWYSWGYEEPALFAAKVSGQGPARILIEGQACSDSQCKNVEVEIDVPTASGAGFDPSDLIPVRER